VKAPHSWAAYRNARLEALNKLLAAQEVLDFDNPTTYRSDNAAIKKAYEESCNVAWRKYLEAVAGES
jgi:hypothetical protein